MIKIHIALYDKVFTVSFHKKFESVQYNAALAMKGAIGGTNTENIYQELGLKFLQNRCKLQRLCLLYKIYKEFFKKFPKKISKNFSSPHSFRATKEISLFRVKHGFFKSSFFLQR